MPLRRRQPRRFAAPRDRPECSARRVLRWHQVVLGGGLPGSERMVRDSSDVTPLPGDEQESMEDQGVFALAAAQKADHADADDWHDEDDALLNMLR